MAGAREGVSRRDGVDGRAAGRPQVPASGLQPHHDNCLVESREPTRIHPHFIRYEKLPMVNLPYVRARQHVPMFSPNELPPPGEGAALCSAWADGVLLRRAVLAAAGVGRPGTRRPRKGRGMTNTLAMTVVAKTMRLSCVPAGGGWDID